MRVSKPLSTMDVLPPRKRVMDGVNAAKPAQSKAEARVQKIYERPLLTMVHKATCDLRTLVKAFKLYMKMEFMRGEEVTFAKKESEKGVVLAKEFQATPTKTSPTKEAYRSHNDTNNVVNGGGEARRSRTSVPAGSPLSDSPTRTNKENTSGDRPRGVCLYDVRVAHTCVKSIPFSGLVRVTQPPDEATIRKWILVNSTKPSGSKPWLVVKEKVTEHRLGDGPMDFYCRQILKQKESESKKDTDKAHSSPGHDSKRKSSSKSRSSSIDSKSKKLKKGQSTLDDMFKRRPSSASSGPQLELTRLEKPAGRMLEIGSSDDDLPLSSLKARVDAKGVGGRTSRGSDKDSIPISISSSASTPTKSPHKSRKSHKSPHKKHKEHKSPHKTHKSPKKHKKRDKSGERNETSETPTKNRKRKSSGKEIDIDASPAKVSKTKTPKAKTPTKVKVKASTTKKRKSGPMKQMTLLQMGTLSEKNDTDAMFHTLQPKTPKTPFLVKKYEKALKADNKRTALYALKQAAGWLPAAIDRLPQPMRDKVYEYVEKTEAKKKLAAMTPEERKEHFRNKRKEKHIEKHGEKPKVVEKQDDSTLSLPPLTPPTDIELPAGLVSTLFGDVAFISEFIATYRDLILPEDRKSLNINPVEIQKTLEVTNEGSYAFLELISFLMAMLLQDDEYKNKRFLDVKLTTLTCGVYTVQELLALCFTAPSKKETLNSEENREDGDSPPTTDSTQLREQLCAAVARISCTEIGDFSSDLRLSLLSLLCETVLKSNTLQEYVADKQADASQAWKDKASNKTATLQIKALEKELDEAEKAEKEEEAKEAAEAAAEEVVPGATPDIGARLRNRRQLSSRELEKREKAKVAARIRGDRQNELVKLERQVGSKQKNFAEIVASARMMRRTIPIGVDRDHTRYWVFQGQPDTVYVEKGWSFTEFPDPKDDSTVLGDSDESFTHEGPFNTGPSQWAVYSGLEAVEQLFNSLSGQGLRESALKTALKTNVLEPAKARPIKETKPSTEGVDADAENKHDWLAALKSDLEELNSSLAVGDLGGLDGAEGESWLESILVATTLKDIGNALITCQESILHKGLKGVMDPSGGTEAQKKAGGYDRVVGNWQTSVRGAPCSARVHLAMNLLESSCINWARSAENAKCRICRRKGRGPFSSMTLLFCDSCDQSYHMECIRPTLAKIPVSGWLCIVCKPMEKRSRRPVGRYADGASDDDSEEDEEGESDDEDSGEEEEVCCVCSSSGDTFSCDTCGDNYHTSCHEPSLRRFPRNAWTCASCKGGGKRTLRSRTRKQAKIVLKPLSESEEEEDDDDDDDDEEEDEAGEEEDDANDDNEEGDEANDDDEEEDAEDVEMEAEDEEVELGGEKNGKDSDGGSSDSSSDSSSEDSE